jgi:cation transport regulator ChaB
MARIKGSEIEGFSPPFPGPSKPEDWKVVTDLPVEVRAALPAAAQQAFLGAYRKAAQVPGLSHDQCLQAAWAAIREASWHAPVDKWVKGHEPSPGGGNNMGDKYPPEVVKLVAHKRRADPTLTEVDALTQVFSERSDLYAQYDRERGQHLPTEPKRATEPNEPAPDALEAASLDLACHIADYCTERNLQVDDPAAVVAAIAHGDGPELYAEVDRERTEWLRTKTGRK